MTRPDHPPSTNIRLRSIFPNLGSNYVWGTPATEPPMLLVSDMVRGEGQGDDPMVAGVEGRLSLLPSPMIATRKSWKLAVCEVSSAGLPDSAN